MSVFLLLALGATVVLLILEGAWLARLPPEKIYRLLVRSVLIAVAFVFAWQIAAENLSWSYAPVVIVLPLIDRIYGGLRRRGHVNRLAQASRQVAQSVGKFAKDSRVAFRDTTRVKPQHHGGKQGPAQSSNDMSMDKALQLLGLDPGSTPQQVKDAHRRLMRKAHPDRGGSSELASQLNRAKDFLLGN